MTQYATRAGRRIADLPTDLTPDSVTAATLTATTSVTTPTIVSSGSSGIAIEGTATNDSAAAGYVGEYISSSVTSPVSFSVSGTAINVTSISLTAGDWDLFGSVQFVAGGTSTGRLIASTSQTTATINNNPIQSGYAVMSITFSIGDPSSLTLSQHRVLLSATTTIYLVANANYTGTVPTAAGFIAARRVR